MNALDLSWPPLATGRTAYLGRRRAGLSAGADRGRAARSGRPRPADAALDAPVVRSLRAPPHRGGGPRSHRPPLRPSSDYRSGASEERPAALPVRAESPELHGQRPVQGAASPPPAWTDRPRNDDPPSPRLLRGGRRGPFPLPQGVVPDRPGRFSFQRLASTRDRGNPRQPLLRRGAHGRGIFDPDLPRRKARAAARDRAVSE